MAILVIGGTGQFGSLVVAELARRGAAVRALGTTEPPGGVPEGVELVIGDVLDVDAMRSLLRTTRTVFVLHPAVADELARALLTLALIDEAEIERIVYLSMMGADVFADASRAAAKLAAEAMIGQRALPATILRPNAAFQNDAALKAAITAEHVYATPLGGIGVTLVDARDVAEIAARELLRRDAADGPLASETIEVVGPDAFTGERMAALWSDVLGAGVRYTGDDLDAVEHAFRAAMPAADAYDLRRVFDGILRQGVLGAPGAAERLATRLGHPLRTYRAFAEETVAQRASA